MKRILKIAYRCAAYVLSGSGIERIKIVGWLNSQILKRLRVKTVEVNGYTMELDEYDQLNLSAMGTFEPIETALIKKEVGEGQVVVDVGANIGYFTLLLAQRVGAQGRVYAFEPFSDNYEILRRNVLANRFENVELSTVALCNNAGEKRLHFEQGDLSDIRLYDSGDSRQSIAVEAANLDDLMPPDTAVDFLKIDIQGGEPAALEGMVQTIESSPRMKMLTEFWPIGLRRSGGDAASYFRRIESLGFEIFDFDHRRKIWSPADLSKILNNCTVENEGFVSLYCAKR